MPRIRRTPATPTPTPEPEPLPMPDLDNIVLEIPPQPTSEQLGIAFTVAEERLVDANRELNLLTANTNPSNREQMDHLANQAEQTTNLRAQAIVAGRSYINALIGELDIENPNSNSGLFAEIRDANRRYRGLGAEEIPIPQPPAPVVPTPPQPEIDSVLPAQLVALLTQAPNNKTFRSLAQPRCALPIPDELRTTEELFAFIVANKQKATPVVNTIKYNYARDRDQLGRCNYRQREMAEVTVTLTAEDFRVILESCTYWEDVHEMVAMRAREMAERQPADELEWEGRQEAHYDGHERLSTEEIGAYAQGSSQSRFDRTLQFIAANFPMVAQRLDEAGDPEPPEDEDGDGDR